MSKDIKKMRKPYAKPAIAIENFTLNQFIASCEINVMLPNWREDLKSKNRLVYTAITKTQQFVDMLGCNVHADTVTDNTDTLCYHTSSSPLFGS